MPPTTHCITVHVIQVPNEITAQENTQTYDVGVSIWARHLAGKAARISPVATMIHIWERNARVLGTGELGGLLSSRALRAGRRTLSMIHMLDKTTVAVRIAYASWSSWTKRSVWSWETMCIERAEGAYETGDFLFHSILPSSWSCQQTQPTLRPTLTPYRNEVGQADKADTKREREARRPRIGECSIGHEARCIDHGKLVNKLHGV